MAKEMNFNLPKEQSSIIKVIGVGGGGSNAVNHMYRQGIRGVDFVVCNTDQQALDMSPVPKKIALGSSLTEGRGAGAQAEVGKNAAIENLDDIKEVLESNTKMVFITAGMGGGTGTGAAPIIAEAAQELGILTVGIVTVPFAFEGKRRKMQAQKGLEELKKHVDTVLVISNDKLREMFGNKKLSEAFAQADNVLSTAAKGIAEIITVEGYVNVDFEDVRTVMTRSGVAIMGSSTTAGEDRAIKGVTQALASPLLNDNNIFGASNILLYISSGTEEVTMDEITEITDFIQEEAGLDADVIWGNGTDEDLGDKLSITVIATGFSGEKLSKVSGEDRKKILSLDKDLPADSHRSGSQHDLPEGLTRKPKLMNDNLRRVMGEKEAEPKLTTPPPSTEKDNGSEPEDVIKHELKEDDGTNDDSSTIDAYRIPEDDAEMNELIDREAPEMKGVAPGQPLPLHDEEDEDDRLQSEDTTDTPEMTDTEPSKGFTLNFDMPAAENEEQDEDTAPQSETETRSEDHDDTDQEEEHAMQIEFSVKKQEPKEEPVKKYDLMEDDLKAASRREEAETTETDDEDQEPRLITKEDTKGQTPRQEFDREWTKKLNHNRADTLQNLKSRIGRFNNPSNINEIEKVPAYKRRNVLLDEPPHSSESSASKYQLGEDDSDENGEGKNRGGLSSGNSYLHESVD